MIEQGPQTPPIPAAPPGLEALEAICRRLSAAGIEHALGGSGLLAAHGFPIRCRDWDLLTEAPLDSIKDALSGLELRILGSSPAYPSDYLVQLAAGERCVEIIGRFAIRTPTGLVRIPTRVAGHRGAVPLCDPRDWLRAYRAMARVDESGRAVDGDKIRMLEALIARAQSG